MKLTDEQSRRFWAKVNKEADNGCWEWMAGRNSREYGNFKLNGKIFIIIWFPILHSIVWRRFDNSCSVCNFGKSPYWI